MGIAIAATATDGHRFSSYRVDPVGHSRAGIVLVQEIFGVNDHIRAVADGFADRGYVVVAPALFDRVEVGVELAYDQAGVQRGRALKAQVGLDDTLQDVAAVQALLAEEGLVCAVVGYCWGGTIAWAAATRLAGFVAAVSYYGGGVAELAAETPLCPVQFHFGETDASIPMTMVEALRMAHPHQELFVYPAGHGFNCEERDTYHADSANLAFTRSLEFLDKCLAAG